MVVRVGACPSSLLPLLASQRQTGGGARAPPVHPPGRGLESTDSPPLPFRALARPIPTPPVTTPLAWFDASYETYLLPAQASEVACPSAAWHLLLLLVPLGLPLGLLPLHPPRSAWHVCPCQLLLLLVPLDRWASTCSVCHPLLLLLPLHRPAQGCRSQMAWLPTAASATLSHGLPLLQLPRRHRLQAALQRCQPASRPSSSPPASARPMSWAAGSAARRGRGSARTGAPLCTAGKEEPIENHIRKGVWHCRPMRTQRPTRTQADGPATPVGQQPVKPGTPGLLAAPADAPADAAAPDEVAFLEPVMSVGGGPVDKCPRTASRPCIGQLATVLPKRS